ncbi:MAG: cytochrome P450 [Acidimicrobiia bacterium]|nr:cytochrome P450 [Acidimicrobiia bacterium]
MAEPLVYNPYAFTVHDNPYDTYRRLRDEAPAYWNPDLSFWALSRYRDVQEAFRDYETYSSLGGVALEARRPIDQANPMFQQMIEIDPPEHTAMRMLVSRAFTVRRVAQMEDEIRRIVNHYIDTVIESGHADLMTDMAGCFPMDVISAVLGIPERDRDMLRDCADRGLIREDGSMEIPQEAVEAIFEVLAYFTEDLDRRRAGEAPDGGLLSDLLELEVDGRALTGAELLGFCLLFVFAGFETTAKMVGNAVELLSRHPDQRAAVVADPSLIPQMVEEVVRFHSSTQYMHRALTRDVEMHGQQMLQGDSVLLLIGAANQDEREFGPAAGEFDIFRNPDRHLGFGYGVHFCLGAALARLEGRVALEEIHRRMGDYTVDHDNKVRFHSGNVSGWKSLPISFTPGPRLARRPSE